MFLRPGQPPASLSLPQQPCAPRTCPSYGRVRVPPGSPPRTASSRRGWTSLARPPPLPRLPPPPKSRPRSPTTPCPMDSPLCSHLGETGTGPKLGGGTADLLKGTPGLLGMAHMAEAGREGWSLGIRNLPLSQGTQKYARPLGNLLGIETSPAGELGLGRTQGCWGLQGP